MAECHYCSTNLCSCSLRSLSNHQREPEDTLPFTFQRGVLLKTQLTNSKHFRQTREHSITLVSNHPLATVWLHARSLQQPRLRQLGTVTNLIWHLTTRHNRVRMNLPSRSAVTSILWDQTFIVKTLPGSRGPHLINVLTKQTEKI